MIFTLCKYNLVDSPLLLTIGWVVVTDWTRGARVRSLMSPLDDADDVARPPASATCYDGRPRPPHLFLRGRLFLHSLLWQNHHHVDNYLPVVEATVTFI